MSTFSSLSSDPPQIAIATGTADALGTYTSTLGTTATLAGGGAAIAFAGFSATAQTTDGTLPQTSTTATAETAGGNTATSYTNTMSVNYPYGSAPVSSSYTIAAAGAHGYDPLSANVTAHDAFSSVGSLSVTSIA
jgi:hypothetical protein